MVEHISQDHDIISSPQIPHIARKYPLRSKRRIDLIQTRLRNVVAIDLGVRQALFELTADKPDAAAVIQNPAILAGRDVRRNEFRLVGGEVFPRLSSDRYALVKQGLIAFRKLVKLAPPNCRLNAYAVHHGYQILPRSRPGRSAVFNLAKPPRPRRAARASAPRAYASRVASH